MVQGPNLPIISQPDSDDCEYLPSPRTPDSDDALPNRSNARLKRKRKSWRAVALDNDETTGNWGRASLLFRLWKTLTSTEANRNGDVPPVQDFVRTYLAVGGARPGCKELLQELAKLRADGTLDEVVIYTGASDCDGWVTFLKECLEAYADTPGLFGRVISSTPDSPRSNGRMIKDLSLVSPDADSVILVDDKPQFAWKGYVIGVPEYKAHVPVQALVRRLHAAAVERGHNDSRVASTLLRVLKRDFQLYPRDTRDFSTDTCLEQVMPAVRKLFSEDPSGEMVKHQKTEGSQPTLAGSVQ